ncbi:ABC-type glycerol-3-phosphate transport system substrate-binding protein [Gracilibacillus halotolerans]|uniref:ABC-type glycerol-3-phosphate transport system substrate-binding protein n=1 Tax=Gracilibacillus halotolerans TaxID=74386 RepID=A0A841RJ97_9BACI|nr:extracellular solute-binding protein [Gracilibacillus halotolerans]MBB6514340.1 ABC-type glycerol-3-phosphate transport system substrate-binding protein [Gracilibacillus halotolerans]
MNRSKEIWIVKLLIILLILTSCSGADDDLYEESYNPVLEKGTKELTLRYQFNPRISGDSSDDRLTEMYDHIEEETGLSIISDSKSLDGYIAILKNELSRGELPDIIQINLMYDDGSGDGKSFLHEEKENLLDLTDFLKESGLMEKFYSLESYKVDGRVYGLPIDGSTMQLYYNKALVEELGGLPETSEDFISFMKEAKNKGYNPIAIDEEDGFSQMPYDLFQGILLETAGREKLYELMNGEASWFNDEFIAALQLMEEIAQLGIPRLEMYTDELYNEFLSGNIVFMYSYFPPNQDNFCVMPFPTVSSSHENSPSLIANFPSGYVSRKRKSN